MLIASAAWGAGVGPFPKVGEYEVLRGDFHMHTVNSDGKLTARQRIEGQRERGIDALAITDHGNFRSARFELQYAPSLGMVPVRGLETGLTGGLKYHLVALGVDPFYAPKNPHRWSATPDGPTAYYQDEMRKVLSAGGLLVLAHPSKESFIEPILWGVEHGVIQGVEVHNGRAFFPHGFDFALKHNLAIFANTDAHGGPGRDYTLVFVKQRSSDGIMDAIRGRRTVALLDGVMRGRQDLLARLVGAMVKVKIEAENGSSYAVFENAGPIKMKGVITGSPEQPIEIAENSKTRVPWTGGSAISVRWDNAFVSSTDNLTTTFNPSR
jgi:hypothetical protein